MAFAPDGTLYIVTYTSLYTMNLSTRHASLLYTDLISGTELIILWTGLAYCDNMLYASDIRGPDDISGLYRIDPNTGETTFLFWNYQVLNNKEYLNDLTSCAFPNTAGHGSIEDSNSLSTTSSDISSAFALSPPSVNQSIDSQPSSPSTLTGVGFLGDSNTDEYRADDNRGGKYASTTLNWMEQLVLRRNLNAGAWGVREEPRRSGFEYNWARSGATARTMITDGQHTGLAQQIASGKVSHAIIYIGGNDFHLHSGTYEEVYDGTLSDAQVQLKVDKIIANISLAADTLLNAGNVKLVVVTVADKGMHPEALQLYPNPAGRQRVTTAINAVNAGIEAMASSKGIAVADINAFSNSILDRTDENGYLNVGGELITMTKRGNEPHHMQLDDWSGHAGTVMSGLMANAIFVDPFNKAYSLNMVPLSEQEILVNAGIKPGFGPGESKLIIFLPLMNR
jgi:lysophospholipase L1-like esterase